VFSGLRALYVCRCFVAYLLLVRIVSQIFAGVLTCGNLLGGSLTGCSLLVVCIVFSRL